MQNYVTVKNRRAFFVCSVAALVVGVASIAYSALIGSSGANPSSISYIQTSQQDAWTTVLRGAPTTSLHDSSGIFIVTIKLAWRRR
ncbi:MAG: hypothetical protein UY09_C0007G0020 [Parcubacteria group bacterium GW2011_GWA2_47_8]|nr:MAG: hypothetical protein UY09_C0007G0020 [Parcubacteria group bacterium GW2011_GWA2_47_8]